jgi:hypothetical protein
MMIRITPHRMSKRITTTTSQRRYILRPVSVHPVRQRKGAADSNPRQIRAIITAVAPVTMPGLFVYSTIRSA